MKANISMYKKSGLFFTLSTLIPWALWFLAGYISHLESDTGATQKWASIIAFLGLFAPVAVAISLSWNNPELRNDMKSRIFNFKGTRPTYIILTLVIMPLSILLAQAISLLFGYSIEQFRFAESFSFTSGVFPVWFMLIMAPLLEELAWHSYGTDSLRLKFNLFTTSVIFALYWGIWHFPCLFIKDYYHSNLVEEGIIYSINFIASLFPFVIIMNWLYYKTNRNMILPVIFHIAAGFFNEIFATDPMSKVIQTGVLTVFSLYLILTDRRFFFHRSERQKSCIFTTTPTAAT
jgi:membrane protease YdiL (CAAX protease family)